MEKKIKKPKSVLQDWIESILIALVLALLIRTWFIQPFKIPSGSMRMTLIEGDHLFVNKWEYGPLVLPQLRTPEFLQDYIKLGWPSWAENYTRVRVPGYSAPHRGDVVVFIFPDDPSKDFIKRLIGLPGDAILIKEGQVWVNGKPLNHPMVRNLTYYNCDTNPSCQYGFEGQTFTVPQGHYFVLGDNSGHSHDSRFWGFVPEANLIGKAEIIFWPPWRWRWIK